ncbi:hypothetical protein ACROYT_G012338 [Oculina patagonica]
MGRVLERNLLLPIYSTKSTPTQVQRGELLEALPDDEQPEDSTRIALVGIDHKLKSLRLECSTEDLFRLSDEDVNLLLAISPSQLRYQTFIDRKRLAFGRRLTEGNQVHVSVTGGRISRDLPGVVRYKGELPTLSGTMFGVELIRNPGQGTTGGTFKGKWYFTCPPDSGVFVGLDKLKPREDPGTDSPSSSPKRNKSSGVFVGFDKLKLREDPGTDSPPSSPKRNKNSQANIKSRLKDMVMPSFLKGKHEQKSSKNGIDSVIFEVGQRVVTFIGDYPAQSWKRGTVRYIGQEKDASGKMRTVVGLEMDERVGDGTGKWNGRQLFDCDRDFAMFVAPESVIKEEDFDGNSKQAVKKETSKKQDDVHGGNDDRTSTLNQSGEISSPEHQRENEHHDSLQRQLREMSQQLANCQQQLREKELQIGERLPEMNGFCEQLREKEHQLEISERLSRARKRQLANLQRQLGEKDQKEENSQRQLRERDEQAETLQRQLRELEQQLSDCQEHLREKELEEANLQGQLREKEQEEENSERQLREIEQQLSERNEHEETSQRQLGEMEQQLTSLQGQLRQKEDESRNLQQQVTTLEGQLRAKDQEVDELEITLSTAQQALTEQQRQQTPDWAISRDQIKLTDKLLGRGGWGSVVEGRYCGCAVAVKQIHELILSPHNRILFEREMDIASRCRHPCLLQFIGATNDEGSPLFVTELMESSLRALLEQRPLSATEVSIISLDVARALSYLHHKTPPIIHRDISSANVLLWRQGDQWRGKVSDYGTANFMQQTMTCAAGAMIYIAPEALTSNQTFKVDVYSFGVLLCEMCIRELPDPERRDQQIAMVTTRQLRALIRRCVDTEPGARPNIEEIIEEFEEPV